MCNAHNHPPGCPCGWGGVWYGNHAGDSGESDWLFKRGASQRTTGRQRATHLTFGTGLTVPNAKCPICAARVFFYRSQEGGRVFFDSLGPPWPKHPCTSSEPMRARPRSATEWAKGKWAPLTHAHIELAQPPDVYCLTGTMSGNEWRFYFKASRIVVAEIIQLRQAEAGRFELSVLDYDAEDKVWLTWTGSCFVKPSKAAKAAPLQDSVLHDHKLAPGAHKISAPSEAPPAPAQHLPSRKLPENLVDCPDCAAKLGPRRWLPHIRKVHGYTPLGSMGAITGRLVLERATVDAAELEAT